MLYFQTRLHKTVLFFTPLGITHIFSLVLIKKRKEKEKQHSFTFLMNTNLFENVSPVFTPHLATTVISDIQD